MREGVPAAYRVESRDESRLGTARRRRVHEDVRARALFEKLEDREREAHDERQQWSILTRHKPAENNAGGHRHKYDVISRNRQSIVLGDFTAGLDGGDCVHHGFSELKVIS